MHSNEKPKTKLPLEASHYDIGYRKPPKSSWFPQGISGNPAGRPTGSKNKPPVLTDQFVSEILVEELNRQVPVEGRVGETPVTISALRAAARNLVHASNAGNIKASQWLISVGQEIEKAALAEQEEDYVYAEFHIEHWEEEIEKAKRRGLPIPQPVPHPDHMYMDDRRRRVIFTCPRNRAEKLDYDAYLAEKAELSRASEPPKVEPQIGELPCEQNPRTEQEGGTQNVSNTETAVGETNNSKAQESHAADPFAKQSTAGLSPEAGTPECATERQVAPPMPTPRSTEDEEPRLRKSAA